MEIIHPEPIRYATGQQFGLTLLSDFHVGSADADYAKIESELAAAAARGDRIAVNGDVFDLILPGDRKRYRPDALHPRLQGRADIVNAAVEWGEELLAGYAGSLVVVGEGNHECFSADTFVLTRAGWKPWPQVTGDDELATVVPATGAVEWQKPLKLHAHGFDGELVEVTGRGLNFAVTPNHRILTEHAAGPRFTEASGLRYGLGSIPVAGTPRDALSCALSDDEIYLLGWAVTDAGFNPKNGLTFYQRPAKVGLIRDALDRLGVKYRECVRVRDITAVCGRQLVGAVQPSHELHVRAGGFRDWVLAAIGRERRVPGVVYDMDRRQFALFLEAVIEGNGSRNDSNTVVIYGREFQLDQLQAACVFQGYRAVMSVDSRGDPRLYVSERRTVGESGYMKHVGRIHYKGVVYCATVPNGTLITRRNGRVLVSGNSAAEKNNSVNATRLLVDRLHKYNPEVRYGGYTGFLDYRFVPADRAAGSRGGTGHRFVVFYHHGAGGGGIGAAVSQFPSLMSFVDADLIWVGHRHHRITTGLQRLSCPLRGAEPRLKTVRYAMSGSYLRTYRGGALSYGAEKLLPPQDQGGVRVVITPGKKGLGVELHA